MQEEFVSRDRDLDTEVHMFFMHVWWLVTVCKLFPSVMEEDEPSALANPQIVQSVLEVCRLGDVNAMMAIVAQHGRWYGCYQEERTGQSPLMVASQYGRMDMVQYLLDVCHAPWNAVDRLGHCAGNFATTHEHWEIVNLLVDYGTRAELILGTIQRQQQERGSSQQGECGASMTTIHGNNDGGQPVLPVEHQPSTKPDYLRHKLHYENDVLLDSDDDAVMMEWERPLMKAHAEVLMMPEDEVGTNQHQHSQQRSTKNKRVLNVGFGMGIIDGILQEDHRPAHHIIIEAHPDVYRRMEHTGWLIKPNVRVCFGKWQDVIPMLIREGTMVDAIFFDTYGEHFMDMEDFHKIMTHILAKPHGVYSFFNGLAPDNLFFHGVACQCVKLQLASLGFDTEFASCEIQIHNNNGDDVWKHVRRKYWHGRDTYYLPIVKWNPRFLATGHVVPQLESPLLKRKGEDASAMMEMDDDCNNGSKRAAVNHQAA
jgi:type IV protein arginine methyltransferase